jgi:hypothetical protein
MHINYKTEIKSWIVYFLTAIIAVWVHEIGHCVPAWINGFAAFPSPAEEYILHNNISVEINQQISLGGYIGTVLFTLLILLIFLYSEFKYKSALFAGVIAVSGMYCALFFINGRGHGGHEFQEAQAALGLSYDGHSLDIFFLILFVLLTVIWILWIKPGYKIILRLLIGSITTFFFFLALEWINNIIFDPIFKANAFIRN